MKCVALILLVVAASGCSKKEPEIALVPEAGVTQPSNKSDAGVALFATRDGGDLGLPPVRPDVLAVVKSRSDERFSQLGLLEKLTVEKADRPKDALKVETVFDAIDSKLKLPVTHRRQVLGRTVNAGYCELGDVEPGITLGVCEYDDPKTLESGREARVQFKIPHREIVEVKNTTVAVQRAEPTPDANAKAKQIADLVKKL